MERTRKIQIISTIVIIGFVLAVFYHYFMGAYLGHDYPYSTFLFDPSDKFADFLKPLNCGKTLSPYSRRGVETTCMSISVVYYPFGELFFYPFSLIHGKSLWIFLGIFLIGWSNFVFKNFSQNNKLANLRDIFILSLTSYPFLFTMDRANLEGYVFLFVVGFCYFYNNNNKWKALLGSICLSLAIAIKPFPSLFLLLLVIEKKWKNIFFIIISSVIINIASVLCFKDDFWVILSATKNNQNEVITRGVIQNLNWDHGHSIIGMLKSLLYIVMSFGNLGDQEIVENWSPLLFNIGTILSVIIFLVTAWYILFKERQFWKIIALITFLMLLLPPLSNDYRLLYIFLPIAFFVNDNRETKNDLIYTILFGLLLIPKSYILAPDMPGVGVIIEPMLMIIFGFLIIQESFKRKIV